MKYRLKGTQKRVIILQPPEDSVYEQAIFIVKQHSPATSETDMVREAERIINAHIFSTPASRLRRRRFALSPIGILILSLSASVLVGLSVLILVL